MPLENKPKAVPEDTDLFPFGFHVGKPYGSVPAKYLDYIDGMDWIKNWPQVKAYIAANRKVIDKELFDEDDDLRY